MRATVENLEVLKTAEGLVDGGWKSCSGWNHFARETVGKQLVRAVDSVGANIAESFGRFHYGEKVQFLYYARGSVFETKYWMNRSRQRNLIAEPEIQNYLDELGLLAKQLNGFLAYIKKQRQNSKTAKKIREPEPTYAVTGIHNEDELFSTEELILIRELNFDHPNTPINQYTNTPPNQEES